MRKKHLQQRLTHESEVRNKLLSELVSVLIDRNRARTIAMKLEAENHSMQQAILKAIHATDDGLPNIAHSHLKYAQAQINGWKE